MRLLALGLLVSVACSSPAALQKRDDLLPTLRSSGFDGVFVAWEARTGKGVCVGGDLCSTRFPPASTFKVPHALLALDYGVVSGPEERFKWDGKKRWLDVWNKDHTLRGGIRHSVVWYFRRLAPMIGGARMRKGLARLRYGNQSIGTKLDLFWLDGSLKISPIEQVRFWHGLHSGKFKTTMRARQQTLDMATLGRANGYTLRAKTGWDRRSGKTNHGWLTGCLDGPKRICFATLLFAKDPFDLKKFIRARFSATAAMLAKLGYVMPKRDK